MYYDEVTYKAFQEFLPASICTALCLFMVAMLAMSMVTDRRDYKSSLESLNAVADLNSSSKAQKMLKRKLIESYILHGSLMGVAIVFFVGLAYSMSFWSSVDPIKSISAHYDVTNVTQNEDLSGKYKMSLPSGKTISCVYDKIPSERKFRLADCTESVPTSVPSSH